MRWRGALLSCSADPRVRESYPRCNRQVFEPSMTTAWRNGREGVAWVEAKLFGISFKALIRRRSYSGNQFQRLIAHVIPAIGETGNHVGSSSNDLPLIFLARSTQTLNKKPRILLR